MSKKKNSSANSRNRNGNSENYNVKNKNGAPSTTKECEETFDSNRLIDPVKVNTNASLDNSSRLASDLDAKASKRDRTETEYESDKGYREITKDIIDVSKEHLEFQRNGKQNLRRLFSIFFSILLILQFISIVVFISLNAATGCQFQISEELLRLYIVSVFVETLSAMAVMLAFAFVSKEELDIVNILNNIIRSYQKFTLQTERDDN